MKCEIKLGYDVMLSGIIPESIEIPLSEFQSYCETELQLAANMICSNTNGLGGSECKSVRVCGKMYSIISGWAKRLGYAPDKYLILFVPCQTENSGQYYLNIAILERSVNTETNCISVMINDETGCCGIDVDGNIVEINNL